MQIIHKHTRAARPIVLLLACIIVFSSVSAVYAGSALGKHNDVFDDNLLNEGLGCQATDYPYSELHPYSDSNPTEITVSKVGLDILYGTTRNIITYFGEVPYANTHSNDGTALDGLDGYPTLGTYTSASTEDTTENEDGESTTVALNAFSYIINGITYTATPTEYWGFTNNSQMSLADLEAVNESDIVSLRLYALSNSPSGFIKGLTNIGYWLMVHLAAIIIMIIRLVVMAKNIDMSDVLEVFHLSELAEKVNETFVYNEEAGGISIFAAFCIIMFVITIIGFGVSYARGTRKTNSLKDILIFAGVGLLVTGMALSGRINNMGSIVSNAISNIGYVSVAAATSSDGGDVFVTQISDAENENKVIQMQEMSMINKCFIDLQICAQFGVSDISELRLMDLGGIESVNNAPRLLICGDDFATQFGGNLGYYYWFANSSATEKTPYNRTYPNTNPRSARYKLESMITCLQDAYNHGDADQKAKILNIMTELSDPHTNRGGMKLLLFSAILVMLILCTWAYAKDALVAKIKMILSLVGMAIAGPLMFTGKQKLVNTGKDVLAIILISFIEVTVYSLMFDLIIFAAAIIIGVDYIRLIVTFLLLLLLLKFSKRLNEEIHKFTSKVERRVMSNNSVVADAKRGVDGWLNNNSERINAIKEKYDKSTKNVYDEDGNVIGQESREGNAVSRLLGLAGNISADSKHTKSYRKMHEEDINTHYTNTKASAALRSKAASDKVKAIEDDITDKFHTALRKFNTDKNANYNSIKEDYSTYTADEKNKFDTAAACQTTIDRMTKDIQDSIDTGNEYVHELYKAQQEYEAAKSDADKMAAQSKVDALKTSIQTNRDYITEQERLRAIEQKTQLDAQNELNELLQRRAEDMTISTLDKDTKDNIKKYGGNVEAGFHQTEQNKRKADLEKALKAQIKVEDEISNSSDETKIGEARRLSSDAQKAAVSANAARLRLEEVESDICMHEESEARKAVADETQEIIDENTFNLNNDAGFDDNRRKLNTAKQDGKFGETVKRTVLFVPKGVKSGAKETAKAVGRAVSKDDFSDVNAHSMESNIKSHAADRMKELSKPSK